MSLWKKSFPFFVKKKEKRGQKSSPSAWNLAEETTSLYQSDYNPLKKRKRNIPACH